MLHQLRNKHPKNVSLAYLNINSIRNKFNFIPHIIENNIDIMVLAETKLDASFPEHQFTLNGMRKPFRLDISERSGGLLVFVNNDIPSKLLTLYKLPCDIQIIPIEISVRSGKILVLSIYRPPKPKHRLFLSYLNRNA